MFKTYKLAASLLIKQFFRIVIGKYAWASFLGGPVGAVVSFFGSWLLGFMAMEGMLVLEFKRLDLLTGVDQHRYKKAIDKLKAAKQLSPDQRAQLIAEVKQATKDFVSIRKYLRP